MDSARPDDNPLAGEDLDARFTQARDFLIGRMLQVQADVMVQFKLYKRNQGDYLDSSEEEIIRQTVEHTSATMLMEILATCSVGVHINERILAQFDPHGGPTFAG